jgi:hypothetical protein
MFAVHCHAHGSDVLLDWSRVEAVRNTAAGPVIDWHCWCGARGSKVGGTSTPRSFDPVVLDVTEPRLTAG